MVCIVLRSAQSLLRLDICKGPWSFVLVLKTLSWSRTLGLELGVLVLSRLVLIMTTSLDPTNRMFLQRCDYLEWL